MEGAADQALQPDVQSESTGTPVLKVCWCVNVNVFICMCVCSKVCGRFPLHTFPQRAEGDQCSYAVIRLPPLPPLPPWPVGTWCPLSCGQPVGIAVSDTRP